MKDTENHTVLFALRMPPATMSSTKGLPAGAHEYKVVGRNSRGTGPESDVSVVNVA